MGIICLRSEEWSPVLQHMLLPPDVAWQQGWAAPAASWHPEEMAWLSFLPCFNLSLLVVSSGHKVSNEFTPLAHLFHLYLFLPEVIFSVVLLSWVSFPLPGMRAGFGAAAVVECSWEEMTGKFYFCWWDVVLARGVFHMEISVAQECTLQTVMGSSACVTFQPASSQLRCRTVLANIHCPLGKLFCFLFLFKSFPVTQCWMAILLFEV